MLVFVDWTAAYSALTGGLIATLTTAWFAAKVFGAKQINELPKNAVDYIRRIEALVGAPVDIVSSGPDREETIVLRHSFA